MKLKFVFKKTLYDGVEEKVLYSEGNSLAEAIDNLNNSDSYDNSIHKDIFTYMNILGYDDLSIINTDIESAENIL
ncbi:MAG: hypothetical protein IKB01_00630 [Lachnospiraceae bacterium]|nr:hypothetical protein [Lachnospiraceae bacterium]